MKVGVRTPNIKKSIKARTTGKAKRAINSTVNPLYGKKGMGFINQPKKAVYNKLYNRTSFSVFKGSSKGIAAIFMFFFYITWVIIKWTFIGVFFTYKWLFYSIPIWVYNIIKQSINKNKAKKNNNIKYDYVD